MADLTPGRDDTVLQAVVKIVAMGDKLASHYGIFSEESQIQRVVKTHKLIPSPMSFVPWFIMRTKMAQLPDVVIEKSSCNSTEGPVKDELSVGRVGELGMVVFGTSYYTHQINPVFVSASFDAEKFREKLWSCYPNGINLTMVRSNGGMFKDPWAFTDLPAYTDVISEHASQRLDVMVRRLTAFAKGRTARAYVFYGPQGTGKTMFAWHMGKAIGGRTLGVEARALVELGVLDFEMLIEALAPSMLIIDDIDGFDMASVINRVRYILPALRAKFPMMTIVVTTNRTECIDRAMLRSKRLDIPVEFPVPNAAERQDIITHHLEQWGVALDEGITIDSIVAETEGHSHAYIADICLRAQHEPMREVLANVKLLVELANKSSFGGGMNMDDVESPKSYVTTD
jgi:hypothetical protein